MLSLLLLVAIALALSWSLPLADAFVKNHANRISSSLLLKATSCDSSDDAMLLLERSSTVFNMNKYAIQPDEIYDAIRFLEKKSPEERTTPEQLYNALSGHEWQLILTTGDLETQKTLGPEIKYVPVVNAVQLFDGSQGIVVYSI